MMKSVERGNGTPESSSLASIFSLEVHTFKFYSMVDLLKMHPAMFEPFEICFFTSKS